VSIRADSAGLHHYIHRQKSLYSRYGLDARFTAWDSQDFCRYVDTEGVIYYREIQESGVPFPPSGEMLTVGGETDLRLFLRNGYECYVRLRPVLPPGSTRILDFGVGCARVARFLYRHIQNIEIHGCDVDRAAIRHLQQDVPFIHAVASETTPPLPYGAGFFGFIFSVSVFTHLTLPAFEDWLVEIHRILAPGALFVLSLHGPTAWQKTDTDAVHRNMLNIDEQAYQKARAGFNAEGFQFSPQTAGSADIDPGQYGINFVSPGRFRDLADSRFELVEYIPAALQSWQDLAILKKR
jgi:SAM-dependent methyltransferase